MSLMCRQTAKVLPEILDCFKGVVSISLKYGVVELFHSIAYSRKIP